MRCFDLSNSEENEQMLNPMIANLLSDLGFRVTLVRPNFFSLFSNLKQQTNSSDMMPPPSNQHTTTYQPPTRKKLS